MDWITIVGLFAGGGAMGFISSLLTFKAFYRQKVAEANKETQLAEQEKIKTVDTLDGLMDKFALRMEKQVVEYEKTLEKQSKEIVELKEINIKQTEEMKKATKTLKNYIAQCETCPNNKLGNSDNDS
jgi:NurA-like 5'-3' nuclease